MRSGPATAGRTPTPEVSHALRSHSPVPREDAALQAAPHARVLLDPALPVVAARALMAMVRSGLAAALDGIGFSDVRIRRDASPAHVLVVCARP